MSWSRGSLLVALLALPASFAFADTVIVSDSCSLPNAVAYLNLSAVDRDNPFNGCKRKEEKASDAHEIQLTAGTTHTVASEIPITTSLTIKGAAADETRPVIRVTSTGSSGRAFKIEVPVPAGVVKTSTRLRLAVTSDTGVASDDYHTPLRRPVFENIDTRVDGTAVYLCRKDKEDQPWLLVGTSTVAAGGSWTITPTNSLPIGVNTLSVAGDVACVDVVKDQSIAVSVYDPLQVAFTGMNIEHADCASSCPADGGIFQTSELLSLDNVKVSGGKATMRGGAIFIAGGGSLLLGTVELSGNSAPQGAAVYAIYNAIAVQNSLVTENSGSTIVEVEKADGVTGFLLTSMVNSTFSGNTGLALSMHKGAALNALTIVNNTLGGIDFHGENVEVHNSIVAGNGVDEPVVSQRDCRSLVYVAANPGPPVVTESPVFKFNLTGAGTGCTASVSAAGSNSKELTGTLMAEVDANGVVTVDGALLPLADNGGVLKSHLPRLRAGDTLSRNAVNPVINQGYLAGLTGSDTALVCPKTDQRDESRTGLCDIGAVEVQLLSGTTFSGGQFESSGPSQSFSLREDLGDEELLPSARCAEVSSSNGSPVTPVPGCPWLLTQPTKGSVTFNADGSYTYTPFSRFHGFDEFIIQVTTTASILNDGTDPLVKSRNVRAQVFMDPETTMTSESLLEGGALDWWYLTLGVLVLGRRVRRSK